MILEGDLDAQNDIVKIPTNVQSIGTYAFANCDSIINLEIPALLTTIGDYAFANCEELVNVDVKGAYLGKYMFANCYALERVDIAEAAYIDAVLTKITEIPEGAFYRCFSLVSLNDTNVIKLNESITAIGEKAFAQSTALTTLKLPSTLLSIAEGAFSGTRSMTTIDIPFIGGARTSTGKAGLFGYIFGHIVESDMSLTIQDDKKSASQIVPVDINTQTTITSNQGYAFYLPRALKNVVITDDVVIGTSAFIEDVNWIGILSASALAGLLSILTSIATIPDPKGGETHD